MDKRNLLLEYSEALAVKIAKLCVEHKIDSNTVFQIKKSSSSVFANITEAQYPENSENLGWINSYMTPIAEMLKGISPYFGTSICASPGGVIDEILYYTRGFDTILESSILMMAFIIASWLAINFTMDRKEEKGKGDIEEDVKRAIASSELIASEVEESNRKAREKQAKKEFR